MSKKPAAGSLEVGRRGPGQAPGASGPVPGASGPAPTQTQLRAPGRDEWSTPSIVLVDLRARWDRGDFFGPTDELFPFVQRLRGPKSSEVEANFARVKDWVGMWENFGLTSPDGLGLTWKTHNFRNLGRNELPSSLEFLTIDVLAEVLGTQDELKEFRRSSSVVLGEFPVLEPWIRRYSRTFLGLVPALPRLLAFVRWMVANPARTHLYLRQVSIPGIDTKFIENHKDVLTDWLRIVLDVPPASSTSFEKEFGFRSKPVLVRFRILDPALAYGPGSLRDLSIPAGDVLAFSRAAFSGSAFRRVFIIENDVTALSLPDMPGSIAMFGRGYGTDFLGDGRWLDGLEVFYWGDLDTHGFAILDQFRQVLPGLQSLFMDESTLLQNRDRWVSEPRPIRRVLANLTAEEAELYQGLIDDRWGPAVRLEQELIEFSVIQRSLTF